MELFCDASFEINPRVSMIRLDISVTIKVAVSKSVHMCSRKRGFHSSP